MFQQVFDIKQIDTLAEAQLLWYCADFTHGKKPYKYAGKKADLPSSHYNGPTWKYYVLLEE